MQFGICADPRRAALAKTVGFDYVESGVSRLLCPESSAAEFEKSLAEHRAAGLPCPVVNGFLPGDLKVTGPALDFDRQHRYLDTVFSRAARAGVEIVVFGSGGARNVPEGFDPADAWAQLVAFTRRAGERAAGHNIRLAMEPLRSGECNILTTLADTIRFVDEVNHPSVRALVDSFHWGRENESAEVIGQAGARLIHAHIATVANRMAPGREDQDFMPFAHGLRAAGYHARLSVEAGLDESRETESMATALRVMRTIFA